MPGFKHYSKPLAEPLKHSLTPTCISSFWTGFAPASPWSSQASLAALAVQAPPPQGSSAWTPVHFSALAGTIAHFYDF